MHTNQMEPSELSHTHTFRTRVPTHTASGTPLSPPQKPRGLPCSARRDKSRLGQTGVSAREEKKKGREEGEKTGWRGREELTPSPPPFQRCLLLSSVSMDGQQQKAGDQTGERRKSHRAECVCCRGAVCVYVSKYEAVAVDLSPSYTLL